MKSLGLTGSKHLARRWAGGLLLAATMVGTGWVGGCAAEARIDKPVLPLTTLENAGLVKRWTAVLALSPALDEKVTGIYRSKDLVYVVSNRNHLVALNAAAGTKLWAVDVEEKGMPIFPPVEVKYKGKAALAVFNPLKLFMLDRRTGQVIVDQFIEKVEDRTTHEFKDKVTRETLACAALDFVATSPGVAFNDTLCVGSEHQFFYGTHIDLLGKVAWGVREDNDSFPVAPAITPEGNVVFCSHNGIIWKVIAETGMAGWNRKTTGDVAGGLAVDSKAVYIPCLDRKLYAFELISSKLLWTARLDGRLDQTPMVAGSSILAIGAGSGLYAVDKVKGEQRWPVVPNVRQLISHSADHAYALDSANNILAISLDTGAVDATIPVNDLAAVATNTTDGTIYVMSTDGRLVAVELAPR